MKANPAKEALIAQLLERVQGSPFLILLNYQGMTVERFAGLRAGLRDQGARCEVAKNTLLRRAAASAALPDDLAADMRGQSAYVAAVEGDADVAAAARAIKEFAKENGMPAIVSGALDGDYLSAAQVEAIADLPPREILLSQLLSALQSPSATLARLVQEPGAALARILQARADQLAAA